MTTEASPWSGTQKPSRSPLPPRASAFDVREARTPTRRATASGTVRTGLIHGRARVVVDINENEIAAK